MANSLTVDQQQLANSAPQHHFYFGGALAGAVVTAQTIGDTPGANEITVLRRMTVRNTHGTTGTPLHLSVQDGAGGAIIGYAMPGANGGEDIQGSPNGFLGSTTKGTQMVIYVGANIGAVGNYTGNYAIEGEYCFITENVKN